jgi:ferritin-like metal-binding protein YciE
MPRLTISPGGERNHMEHNELKELYIDELRDLYDAENKLVKALAKLAKAASSDRLRAGFEEHLEQTKGHVSRLEEIFEALDEKPTGKKCAGMAGLIKEGQEIMDEEFSAEVMDAALISAAQRVEHYEIAAYGCVSTWAQLLGESEAGALLEKTLEEEKETDQKLTELAEAINVEAKGSGESGEGEEEEEEEQDAFARKAKSARA